MRVASIKLEGIAGLGGLTINGLEERDQIYISGRNGVGKSRLLLCVAIAGRNEFAFPDSSKMISSDAQSAEIEIEFVLEEAERQRLELILSHTSGTSRFPDSRIVARSVFSRTGQYSFDWKGSESLIQFGHLVNPHMLSEDLSFLNIAYLPADRPISKDPELRLSMSSLSHSKLIETSTQTLFQQLGDFGPPQPADVFPGLAAMHYAQFLETDSGNNKYGEAFDRIVATFKRATGKTVCPPSVLPDGNIALLVELPHGERHSVNALSSGELIMLQQLQFIEQHFIKDTLLLVDEPEQHLHPSLEVEVAKSLVQRAGNGQAWIATHSPSILNAVSGTDVLILSRNSHSSSVQPRFADSSEVQYGLFAELGVSPGLWVPGNFLVIVEGETDKRYLQKLLPEEFANAFFIVAGDRSSLRSIVHRLEEEPQIPYLAICDRDAAPRKDVEAWNAKKSHFMWSGYSIESLLLDSELIFNRLENDPGYPSIENVQAELNRVCEAQKERAKLTWINRRVASLVPSKFKLSSKVEVNCEKQIDVANRRLRCIAENRNIFEEEFAEAWKEETLAFVEPKRALRDFRNRTYRNSGAFTLQLFQELSKARSNRDLGLLQQKICIAMGHTD